MIPPDRTSVLLIPFSFRQSFTWVARAPERHIIRIGFLIRLSFSRLFGISFIGISSEFGMRASLNSCGVRTSRRK
jgi:glycopeptide antibiotics resistance protein